MGEGERSAPRRACLGLVEATLKLDFTSRSGAREARRYRARRENADLPRVPALALHAAARGERGKSRGLGP